MNARLWNIVGELKPIGDFESSAPLWNSRLWRCLKVSDGTVTSIRDGLNHSVESNEMFYAVEEKDLTSND